MDRFLASRLQMHNGRVGARGRLMKKFITISVYAAFVAIMAVIYVEWEHENDRKNRSEYAAALHTAILEMERQCPKLCSKVINEFTYRNFAKQKFIDITYLKHKLSIGDDYRSEAWTYLGSLFFVVTTTTTIGYGYPTPKTVQGRITTMALYIFGVPFTFMALMDIVDLLLMLEKMVLNQIDNQVKTVRLKLRDCLSHCFASFCGCCIRRNKVSPSDDGPLPVKHKVDRSGHITNHRSNMSTSVTPSKSVNKTKSKDRSPSISSPSTSKSALSSTRKVAKASSLANMSQLEAPKTYKKSSRPGSPQRKNKFSDIEEVSVKDSIGHASSTCSEKTVLQTRTNPSTSLSGATSEIKHGTESDSDNIVKQVESEDIHTRKMEKKNKLIFYVGSDNEEENFNNNNGFDMASCPQGSMDETFSRKKWFSKNVGSNDDYDDMERGDLAVRNDNNNNMVNDKISNPKPTFENENESQKLWRKAINNTFKRFRRNRFTDENSVNISVTNPSDSHINLIKPTLKRLDFKEVPHVQASGNNIKEPYPGIKSTDSSKSEQINSQQTVQVSYGKSEHDDNDSVHNIYYNVNTPESSTQNLIIKDPGLSVQNLSVNSTATSEQLSHHPNANVSTSHNNVYLSSAQLLNIPETDSTRCVSYPAMSSTRHASNPNMSNQAIISQSHTGHMLKQKLSNTSHADPDVSHTGTLIPRNHRSLPSSVTKFPPSSSSSTAPKRFNSARYSTRSSQFGAGSRKNSSYHGARWTDLNRNVSENRKNSFIEEVESAPNLTLLFTMVNLVIYLAIGSVMFVSYENWTYLDALYFMLTSISTVGFGDILPQSSSLFRFLSSLYIVLGLALLAKIIGDIRGAMFKAMKNVASQIHEVGINAKQKLTKSARKMSFRSLSTKSLKKSNTKARLPQPSPRKRMRRNSLVSNQSQQEEVHNINDDSHENIKTQHNTSTQAKWPDHLRLTAHPASSLSNQHTCSASSNHHHHHQPPFIESIPENTTNERTDT